MSAGDGPATSELRRELGTPGAVFMGLGSIIGTGLFVSLGVAAGVAGHGILLALPAAAVLALFSGLSSAQLAAAHPVSGGTYEYGYRFLSPSLGFTAGWTFLLAKSASAATAALGVAGYLLAVTERGGALLVPIAAVTVIALTVLVAGGIRRSNRVNLVIVGITLAIFGAFLAAGLPASLGAAWTGAFGPPESPPADFGTPTALLHATALLFVAYTGYGRIATLGEEVRDPGRVIPRAIWITLGVVAVLYTAVAVVSLHALGAEGFARATDETAAPLQIVAGLLALPGLGFLMGIAAVTAMLGVLLNLILGLSRVALAMGRRRDLPGRLARIHAPSAGPRAAVITVGAVIFLLVLTGDVRTTWSFSAFTVLLYYALTNLAALRLPAASRRYPRWVPTAGLAGCLFLAFQVDPGFWIVGSVVIAGGLAARWAVRRWTPTG